MSKRFQLCAEDHRGVTRVMKHVKFEEGERLVSKDRAERVLDQEGAIIGFQLKLTQGAPDKLKVPPFQTSGMEASSSSSPNFLSRRETEAVAGLHGESRTKHLSEPQKLERVRRHFSAEDLVERAVNKFEALYPQAKKVAA